MKKIGLFGGAFDPPHRGHLAVLQDLCRKDVFDEIWIIPVFSHPYEKKMASYDVRLNLLKLLISEIETNKIIQVNTIEKDLSKTPVYTYDTIQGLKKRHPKYEFTLILGTDTKNDLPNWYRYDDLKNEVSFFFVPRNGFETSPFPKVSSSDIRENLRQSKPIDHLTTPHIAEYLISHHIYY